MTHVALLLSRQFLGSLVLSVIIGSLVASYLMDLWLRGFAYQTQISWWIFFVAGGSTFMIALLTVSWHLYKAASRNPVETLRYE